MLRRTTNPIAPAVTSVAVKERSLPVRSLGPRRGSRGTIRR